MPLTAILVLGASAGQLGVVSAARWFPYLVFGLLAGVVLDHVPRRPVLIVSHVARALLLLSIPVAFGLDALHLEHLVVVSFGVGALMIFSDAAYQSVVPSLVGPLELFDANAKLEGSRSMAQIVGPSIGGALVQVLGPPIAIATNSVAFLVDALLLASIRLVERVPSRPHRLVKVWSEIGEGLHWVFGHPLLRPIQLASMSFIGANSIWVTVYLLFLTRQLGLEPWQVSLLLAPGVLAHCSARSVPVGSWLRSAWGGRSSPLTS